MKKNKKRVVSSTTAIVTALAIIVTGTLAWFGGTRALNQFEFSAEVAVDQALANLHDDFNRDSGEKKIYVENTGNKPVYARIRLTEKMVLGDDTRITGGSGWTNRRWATQAGSANGTMISTDPDKNQVKWILGDNASYPYSSAKDANDWATSALATKELKIADVLGDASGTKFDMQITDNKNTLAGSIRSYAQYANMSDAVKPSYVGWIITSDGFAYWSQPLYPGDATGLLLAKVEAPAHIAGHSKYAYAIDAYMEYLTADEAVNVWVNGGTASEGRTTVASATDAEGKALIQGGTFSGQNLPGLIKTELDMGSHAEGDTFSFGGEDYIIVKKEEGAALIVLKEVSATQIAWSTNTDLAIDSVYIGSALDVESRAVSSTKMANPVISKSLLLHNMRTEAGLSKPGAGLMGYVSLSKDEMNTYFVDDTARIARTAANVAQVYWTRSVGTISTTNLTPAAATRVTHLGAVHEHAGRTALNHTRLATWVAIK